MNGVVFDFDGVLANSEPLSWRAWAEVLAPAGIEISDDDVVACTGTTSSDTWLYFSRRAQLPPYEEVLLAVDERRRASYDQHLDGFADAIEAAKDLAMVGVPLAIASSSSRVNLDIKMDVLGVARFFDVTVAGDEVERGKPEPDLYSTAAAQLGIDPGSSVAVEDTAIGADSAAAAGLRPVIVNRMGFPTGRHTVVSEVSADLLLLWLGRT